jgi:hypothetical protein
VGWKCEKYDCEVYRPIISWKVSSECLLFINILRETINFILSDKRKMMLFLIHDIRQILWCISKFHNKVNLFVFI